MPFTKEDKVLIRDLFELKGYNVKRLIRNFLSKGWNTGLVYKML